MNTYSIQYSPKLIEFINVVKFFLLKKPIKVRFSDKTRVSLLSKQKNR